MYLSPIECIGFSLEYIHFFYGCTRIYEWYALFLPILVKVNNPHPCMMEQKCIYFISTSEVNGPRTCTTRQ